MVRAAKEREREKVGIEAGREGEKEEKGMGVVREEEEEEKRIERKSERVVERIWVEQGRLWTRRRRSIPGISTRRFEC